MTTGNPVLQSSAFALPNEGEAVMTVRGVVRNTAVLLVLTLSAGWASVWLVGQGVPVTDLAILAGFNGVVLGIFAAFVPRLAGLVAPLYAIAQGAFLGAITTLLEERHPGIALAATGCAVSTLAATLIAYLAGFLRPSGGLSRGIVIATGGMAILYAAQYGLRGFGLDVPYFHEGSPWGMAFSLLVIGLAVFNLVLDFAFVERGVGRGAPKYLEWYAAFGLIVTLLWLYFEILHLLSRLTVRRV